MRVALFQDVFGVPDTLDDAMVVGSAASAPRSAFAVLVRKAVAVLEHVEKFPVVVHDSPGSGHGLQARVDCASLIFKVLTKRLSFKLKRFPDERCVLRESPFLQRQCVA